MIMNDVVSINGELFPLIEAKIPLLDRGLLYGDGIFEGVRFYDKKPLLHIPHFERFCKSAEYIRLSPPSLESYNHEIKKTIEASGYADGYLRIILTRGVGKMGITPTGYGKPNFYVIVTNIALYDKSLYENGIELVVSKSRRIHKDSFSGQVKSLAYLPNIICLWEALESGATEALMLDCDGYVSEASVANIFALMGNTLLTPSLEANCLEGVTRNQIIKLSSKLGFNVEEKLFKLDELLEADEVFLTGTGAGVVPVASINGTKFKIDRSKKIREVYESSIKDNCQAL